MDVNKAIKSKKEYEKMLTDYSNELRSRSNKDKLYEFCSLRGMDKSTVDEAGMFYIGDMTEMLLPNFYDSIEELGIISETNKKPIFNNRWVIPIKNSDGFVQNFVGYSPLADERYIYGTSKYYRRRATLYGLENLKLAYELGYAFVTEGITDTIRLRDIGIKNSFAMCGTHSSEFILRQLGRCRYGVILIPDRDDPGIRAAREWKCDRSITLYISLLFKDIDEMLRVDNEDGTKSRNEENVSWFMQYAEACKKCLIDQYNHGSSKVHEVVTML